MKKKTTKKQSKKLKNKKTRKPTKKVVSKKSPRSTKKTTAKKPVKETKKAAPIVIENELPKKRRGRPKKIREDNSATVFDIQSVPLMIDGERVLESDIIEAKEIAVVIEEKKSLMYFTEDTTKAIVEYNAETDRSKRDAIYNSRIRYAFEKIAENVFNTFKFSYMEVSSDTVQKEAVSHMVTNLEKYDPSKGKAFGYFSIVAKNWYILENNNNYKRFKKQTDIISEPGPTHGEFVVSPDHETTNRDNREFIHLMVDYLDANIKSLFPKKRDYQIAGAVVEIFRLCDSIEMFNKKALYLYIRDIAGCQTQHITKVINRMMFVYKNIRREYLNRGIITGEYCSCQNYIR